MPRTDPLLRTKLHPPFIRPGLVSRPRLQHQITQGLCGPLTLITAPAGFGKTTLVAANIAGCAKQVAWLSLDRDDNQAGRFLNYLIAAFQSVDHRIGVDAAQLLAGLPPASAESVLTSLINDLDTAAGEMVLVLDDYQFISSQAVHAGVAFLLDHCPSIFHILIASRSDPALPLARLRARGQLVELRTTDLRFTPAEAAQFLTEVMKLRLDDGSVAILEERTEGWVAGLQMAALSMRDREDIHGFIESFSGTNRHILDYLLEEILAGLSPELQRFLLYTSILERLTAPLCDMLLAGDEALASGGPDDPIAPRSPAHPPSASVLDFLERQNLFLVSLDDERVWFRYHHLFADLLRARLLQDQPNLVPILHVRVSGWLEQKGFILEAVHHLFAANEINQAADLIERYGPARWAENDPSVMQMADHLPPEILVTRPKIGIYQAWLLIMQAAVNKAVPLLMNIARSINDAGPEAGQQWILTIIGLALTFLGRPVNIPGFDPLPDDRALDEIPAEDLILRDTAEILYGMALARRGEINRAAQAAIKFMKREKTADERLAVPTMVPFLARLYLIQGDLHAAASLCHEYLHSIHDKGIRFINAGGDTNVSMGEVCYEWNLLEEAEQYIRAGLQANVPWGNIMTDGWGLIALAHVLRAKGDHAGTMQAVEKFEKRMQGISQPKEFLEDYHTLRFRMLVAFGDLQTASEWAEQIYQSEEFHFHPEQYRIPLARLRLAQGRFAEVEEILAGKPSLEGAGSRIARQIESNLLLAAALAGQQRLTDALPLIETCLAAAEPEGYIRPFLDAGEPARELLAACLRLANSGHTLFARKVLDAFLQSSSAGSPGVQRAGRVEQMVEQLTERELEVLHLMEQGKTNQEIARELVVASGTIKAHAASIYRKLDVANRTEAVARARKLAILP